MTTVAPTTQKSNAEMQAEIANLLDEPTRRGFINTTNNITRLGNRKPKMVEPRRNKLREIVAANRKIVQLYNLYARAQVATESRLTFRLPVFDDLELVEEAESPDATDAEHVQEENGEQNEDEQSQEPAEYPELEKEQTHSVQRVEPTQNEDSETQQEAADSLDTPEGATTGAYSPPYQAIDNAQGKYIAQLAVDAVDQADQAPNSLPNVHASVTPVRNPAAFPIGRLQSVQAQYYPSARALHVCTHRDSNGVVVQVTADLQDGPVNHFIIDDARIITALGLREGGNDTISLNKASFRPDETFAFEIIYGQHARNLDDFVVGRFQSARHAYLYWLDHRGAADPVHAPYLNEARTVAHELGRRSFDVWGEIDRYWQYEQGRGLKKRREDRLANLGEDPVYDAAVKTSSKVAVVSMW